MSLKLGNNCPLIRRKIIKKITHNRRTKMKEIRLKFNSKDKENIDRLKEKYGFKTTEDLFRFLVTIFAQHYAKKAGIGQTDSVLGFYI
jgi:hypothetical protein